MRLIFSPFPIPPGHSQEPSISRFISLSIYLDDVLPPFEFLRPLQVLTRLLFPLTLTGSNLIILCWIIFDC